MRRKCNELVIDMKRFVFSLPIVPLLGIIAGIFYAFFLEFGFDKQGLLLYDDTWQIFFLIALALLIVPCVLCALSAGRTDTLNDKLFLTKKSGKVANILNILAIVSVGLYGILQSVASFRRLDIAGIILGILAIISCWSLYSLNSFANTGEVKKHYSILFLVPMMWMAYRLILVFREVSINPVVSSYFYDVMSMILIMVAYFSCISLMYQQKKYFMWMLWSTLAIGVSLSVLIGRLIYDIRTGLFIQRIQHPMANSDMICLYLLLVFGLCFSASAVSRWFTERCHNLYKHNKGNPTLDSTHK